MEMTTNQACEMFDANRQRLNEDIAAGHYFCAPEAALGTTRLWDDADLAGLFVYQHICRAFGEHKRFPKLLAARYACAVVSAFRANASVSHLRADFPLDGFNDQPVICNVNDAPHLKGKDTSAMCAVFSIYLGEVAKLIAEQKQGRLGASARELAREAQKIASSGLKAEGE
jgi:hypothetical protein